MQKTSIPGSARRACFALLLAVGCALPLAAGPAAAAVISPAAAVGGAVPHTAHTTSVIAAAAPAARKFANCAALNRVYPHGVGKSGATDKVKGKTKPVTNFTRNNAIYAANTKSDADKDGVACEKR